MESDRRSQIEALFEAALEVPTETRAEWLEAECVGDPELLADEPQVAEVHALLAAHELADRIFGDRSSPEDERLGPYRVIRELGRGGMGVVHLAERDDGQFQRRVAIKVVGTADAGDPIYKRFLAERQILAGLDHPNIARLLDGGIADDGRPYLVLEYVEGLPLTTYCERHRLGVEDRVRLFVEVCEAVQHAHQNLVIHRDLKPSNIMVTPAGQVRLLDFGIAKLLNPTLSAVQAPVTRLDLRAMTPEYASPEQVRGDTITTASDIYSLGVLLYELLTGESPYPAAGSPPQLVAAVCEHDPERPSSRVTRLDGGENGAAAFDVSPERLRRQLRGDLDGITLMALRKEPGRRYASAGLLGQDLRRYLEGQPVLAHRGSQRYRLARFVRRHRVATVAAALVALSLTGGLGAALWQAERADRERVRADRARADAELALAQSEEVTRFLTGLFETGESDPISQGDQVTALDLLRRGAARADDLAEHPDVQARMLDVIGQMHRHLGHNHEAREHLERAVAILRRSAPGSPELANSLIHLSWVHRGLGERDEALRLTTEALAIRRAALPPEHPDIAEAVYQVGWVTPIPAEAERLYREALTLFEATGARPERQVSLLQGLATHARRRGDGAAAVASDREAVRLARALFGPDDYRTGYPMVHLADQVRDIEEDPVEAERLYRRGMELISARRGEYHTDLIHGLTSLAWLKSQQGDHAEAERLYRRAVDIRLAATGPEHPSLAGLIGTLAGELERQGRFDEAETLAQESLDMWARLVGPGTRAYGSALPRLASIVSRQGRVEEASRLWEESIRLLAPRGDESPVLAAEARREYGRMLAEHGAFERAERELLESLRILDSVFGGADHPNPRETRRALAELYEAWGRPELAESHRVPPGRFTGY